MLIGLSGYAQSGKDTIANYLIKDHGFIRRAFADNLRNVLYDLNPMLESGFLQAKVDVEGWDKAKQHPEVRRLLQDLGLAARNHIHPEVWVSAALDRVLNDRIVVTDVRFLNEARAIKERGGEIWRVERPGVGAVNNHISETEMDGYKFDQVLINEAGLDHLYNQVLLSMGVRL